MYTSSANSFLFPECKKTKSGLNLKAGLIAYYPFNGNTNDESGNNNNPSSNGGNLSFDEHGKPNSALNLTGNGQGLVINNNGKISFSSDLTVSFNVMIRNIATQVFLTMVDISNGAGATFAIGTIIPDNNGLVYSIVNKEAVCNTPHTAAQVSNIDTRTIIQPESWICSFGKGTMKTYINGTLISTQASTDNSLEICPNAQLIIGGWWNGDPLVLNGKIDEVRLYNRELNTDEIAELSRYFK